MKIICVGRNYVDHAKELNNEIPKEPVIFIKPESSLFMGNDWEIPDFGDNFHYELELVFRIAKDINQKSVLDYKIFDGIGLGIDFTERTIQSQLKKKGLPWEKSKAFDKSAMISNFLSLDKFSDLNKISFWLEKNEVLVQHGNSELMIYSPLDVVKEIINYFSLNKGDLLFTGTPAGVGKVNKDDKFKGFLEKEILLNFRAK